MEFGGPRPPLYNEYFPTLLTEQVWERIEAQEVEYKEDLEGWRKRIDDERRNIETHTRRIKRDVETFFDETDFAIRFCSSVHEDVLVEFLRKQMTDQDEYMQKIRGREVLCERLIIMIDSMLEEKEATSEKTENESTSTSGEQKKNASKSKGKKNKKKKSHK